MDGKKYVLYSVRMRRSLLCLSLVFVLLTITSCGQAAPPVVGGSQPKEVSITAIPFLYYVQQENRIVAQLAYWEPNTWEVFLTNESVYSVHAASHDIFLRAWDGADWLVLAGSQTVAPLYRHW